MQERKTLNNIKRLRDEELLSRAITVEDAMTGNAHIPGRMMKLKTENLSALACMLLKKTEESGGYSYI